MSLSVGFIVYSVLQRSGFIHRFLFRACSAQLFCLRIYLLVSMTSRRACPKRPNPTPWFKGRGHDWNASKKTTEYDPLSTGGYTPTITDKCVKLTPCNHVASCQFMRLSVAHLWFPSQFHYIEKCTKFECHTVTPFSSIATHWWELLTYIHCACRSEKGAFCPTWPLRIAFASNTISHWHRSLLTGSFFRAAGPWRDASYSDCKGHVPFGRTGHCGITPQCRRVGCRVVVSCKTEAAKSVRP